MKIVQLYHWLVRDTVWHYHGLETGNFCWRRWHDGQWEYRAMTEAESKDAIWDWAIK